MSFQLLMSFSSFRTFIMCVARFLSRGRSKSVGYLELPLTTSLVLTTRFSILSFGIMPSTLSIRISAASLPTSTPLCSTVVSCGSHATARLPLVKPHTEMPSGIRNPMLFAVYITPIAVSSLTQKNASGGLGPCRTAGVMLSASARLSHSNIRSSSGFSPAFSRASL